MAALVADRAVAALAAEGDIRTAEAAVEAGGGSAGLDRAVAAAEAAAAAGVPAAAAEAAAAAGAEASAGLVAPAEAAGPVALAGPDALGAAAEMQPALAAD